MYSLVFFLSSVLGKKLLDENEFYIFNVSIVLFSMAFTYCFLGTEQLFVRFTDTSSSKTLISKYIILYMMTGSCVYILTSTLLVNFFIYKSIGYILPFVISLLVTISVVTYNFYRVNKSFFSAQLIVGYWKLILPFSLLVSYSMAYEYALLMLLIISIIIIFLILFKISKDIELTQEKHDDVFVLSIGFAFSLLVLLFLNNFDRWVVEHYLGKKMFTSYAYMLTITIMPFSLISSYFGFKEVAYLKSNYNKTQFNRKLVLVAFISLLMFFLWFNLIYLIKDYIDLDINYELFIPLAVVVVSRCIYSLLSALFGLKASKSNIITVNIYTVVSIILGLLYLMQSDVTMQKIVFVMCGIWVSRMLIFLLYSRKIEEYSNEV
ncbi:TPA: hypothetical protein I7190_26235 [Vibrio vulnificus]|nr:hypothetical protein [Vibrio vulnificus]